jgi:hypothetical protein
MWNHRKSTICSLVCTRAVMVVFAVIAAFLPKILGFYEVRGTLDAESIMPLMVILYCECAPALAALISLDRLLKNIRNERVFTVDNVRLLRVISWSCFGAAVLALAATKYYTLFIAVAGAAAFMGLILRVVKNVIEEAVVIKEENDYTI